MVILGDALWYISISLKAEKSISGFHLPDSNLLPAKAKVKFFLKKARKICLFKIFILSLTNRSIIKRF